MGRPDRARRKEPLRQFRSRQHSAARSRLGLSADQLKSLLEYLDRCLEGAPCDRSLRLTNAWAARMGPQPERLAVALAHFGGYCDCEVLATVTPDQFGWPD